MKHLVALMLVLVTAVAHGDVTGLITPPLSPSQLPQCAGGLVVHVVAASSETDWVPAGVIGPVSCLYIFAAAGGSTINSLAVTPANGSSLIIINDSVTDPLYFPNQGPGQPANQFIVAGAVAGVGTQVVGSSARITRSSNHWVFEG